MHSYRGYPAVVIKSINTPVTSFAVLAAQFHLKFKARKFLIAQQLSEM
jgi:hypothetical protein